MFADLLAKEIQPQNIDISHITEIEISQGLKQKIQKLLENEENSYAKVFNKTAVVQTDRNYVFFSSHWLYLAVLCKKYAEALKPYGDFFDQNFRGNQELLCLLAKRQFDAPELNNLLPDPTDKERMIKFIMSDSVYRPGKCLINGENGSRVRTIKDIFGSCILKKIAVPDASSGYLGNLIYYLAKNPSVYDELEVEIKKQIENANYVKKLSSVVKDCAKEIVDCVYKLDKFQRIEQFFVNTGMSIKINTEDMDDILPVGKFLRYMFTLPQSNMFEPNDNDEVKTRVFDDIEYDIKIEEFPVKCRLTTEWKGAELEENGDGNFLKALVAVINKYYADLIEIKNEMGEYYLYMYKNLFKANDLPDIFKTDFSRRYITSLLAKPFVILTGNSGTGKTRIAKQFAEYMERTPEEGKKNWLIVPVGADWTDNAKVLGFYNPLADNGTGKYEKTGIINLIEEANVHQSIPYFIILDEMNLSHVERYFSDFLSHMEILGSKFELDGYEGTLNFPDNLFVIGTVNIDETTYMFSPKVLDRANVVEFKPEKKEVLSLFTEPVYAEKVKPANDGSAEAFLKLAKEIRAGKCTLDDSKDENLNSAMEAVQQIFGDIYEVIEQKGFEFAYRTVREIRQYISAAYEISDTDAEFELYRAIDEQLLQKVLPKIHGNRKEIGELLDKLENICVQTEMPLELSAQKIKQMKGKLAAIQYASFI